MGHAHHRLPEKDRLERDAKIVELHHGQGLAPEVLSLRFGVQRKRIYDILRKARNAGA